jgi:hypothetical protein
MRPGLFIMLVAAIGVAAGVRAEEDVRLSAEVDAREIGVEDQVQPTISATGRGLSGREEVTFPALKKLRLVGGPLRSIQSLRVNDVALQGETYTYVLQATRAGKAEIGAVRLHLPGGSEKATEPIAIDVAPGSARSKTPSSVGPLSEGTYDMPLRSRSREEMRAPKIVAEAQASRLKLHVGEPLRLVYQVYTQTDLTVIDFSEAPKYPGFWAEDIELPASAMRRGEPTMFEGERYLRVTKSEMLLFPMKPGQLTIPAAGLRIGLAWAGGDSVVRETKPLTIEVDGIPEAPGSSGAVGQFKASASLDRTSITLGEAVTLRFTLTGRGNLRWIERGPALDVPRVKLFPPQVKDAIKVDASGMSGSRTWEYVLVPQAGGRVELPPLALTYFDPVAERSVRAEAAGLAVEVLSTPSTAAGMGPATGTASLAAGGIPLRAELEISAGRALSLGTRGLTVIGAFVVLGHAVLWLTGRRRYGLRSGNAVGPRRTSVRAALAEIERARARGTSKEQAALLIEKALTDTFGPLDTAYGAAGNEADQAALDVLNEVRFLRYAPQLGDYSEKIREVAARAAEVIRRGA